LLLATCGDERKAGPTVAVSGPPGSGKTTYAKRLAEELGLEYYSAGRIFRELAREKGMSIEELNRLASEDPRIDMEIDARTLKIGCKGGVVVEGHLVAWVLGSLADVRVYVTAPLDVRVRRIASREKRPLEDVYRETVFREYLQWRRFLDYYGIDANSLHIFNLVIDTGFLDIEEAYSIIRSYVCRSLARRGYQLPGCSGGEGKA
jgi:cytidylate kinase